MASGLFGLENFTIPLGEKAEVLKGVTRKWFAEDPRQNITQ